METSSNTKKNLSKGIATTLIFAICFVLTTIALFFANTSVANNLFHTGKIAINLNDKKPVITADEFLFEPGMTVEKSFFIKNEGTWDAYYKLYFDNVSGGLANVLDVTIKDGATVVYDGTAAGFSKENVAVASSELRVGERRDMTVTFHFPESAGNQTQSRNLTFKLCADATQTKNNPNRAFR